MFSGPQLDVRLLPAGRRPRVQRVLCAALVPALAVPLVLALSGAPAAPPAADATGVRVEPGPVAALPVAPPAAPIRAVAAPAPTTTAAPTTTTAPAPTTTRPRPTTTTTRPPAPTTTRPRPTTTRPPAPTTAPRRPAPAPVAPAPTPPPAPPRPPAPTTTRPPARHDSGQATWYRWKAGNCASNDLPKGTVVTVTATASGRTTTCVVGDTGAFRRPTIIDLDATVFEQIAPLGAGRINVTISW